MTDARLKKAQILGIEAEKKMMELLLQWTPMDDARVSDLKYIASTARTLAFEAMRKLDEAAQ